MANINPKGVDTTTGQAKLLASGDTLVDSDGNSIIDSKITNLYGVNAAQSISSSNSPLGLMGIPANTLTADGDWLLFNVVVRWISGVTVDYTFTFAGTTIFTRPSFFVSAAAYSVFEFRVYRNTSTTARVMCTDSSEMPTGTTSTALSPRVASTASVAADWATGLVLGISNGSTSTYELNHWSAVKYDAVVTPYP